MEISQVSQHGIAGALLQWWAERRARTDASIRQLRVIETLPLNSKQKLMLVECAGQRFLLGVGLEQISSIVKVDSSEETIGADGLCD